MSTSDSVCNAGQDETEDAPDPIRAQLIKLGLTRFYRAAEVVEKKHRVVFGVDTGMIHAGIMKVHIVLGEEHDVDMEETYGAMVMILEMIIAEDPRRKGRHA